MSKVLDNYFYILLSILLFMFNALLSLLNQSIVDSILSRFVQCSKCNIDDIFIIYCI